MSTCSIIKGEIESQLEEIHRMQLGDDDTKVAISGVHELAEAAVKLESSDREERKIQIEEAKIEIERKKLEAETKDRRVKNLLTFCSIALPLGGAIWANKFNWAKELGEEGGIMTLKCGKKAIEYLSTFRK